MLSPKSRIRGGVAAANADAVDAEADPEADADAEVDANADVDSA